jgi:hypothetical protein
VFYNYKFPAQPDPISTSLMPNYVTSAPNINYPSHQSDNIGIQLLAQMNNTFAIRFSGAYLKLARRPWSECHSRPSRKKSARVCGQDQWSRRESFIPLRPFAVSCDYRGHVSAERG